MDLRGGRRQQRHEGQTEGALPPSESPTSPGTKLTLIIQRQSISVNIARRGTTSFVQTDAVSPLRLSLKFQGMSDVSAQSPSLCHC